MINHLLNKEINKIKWDECINNSFNGNIYAYSWYLDIVCPQWEALVEDDYLRVFPLTAGKKAGICYLFQPPFSQQLGIFSKIKLNEEITEEFISKIPGKFKFAEINLNLFNKLDGNKHILKNNLTHELDLISPYENIYKNYSNNIKRNIKQALNSELSISKKVDITQIIEIFKNNKGKNIKTLGKNDYNILKKIVQICLNNRLAYVWGVFTKKNNLCAGAVFVESNKKVIFLFSATTNEGKANGAMSFLIDKFIKENSQRNLTLDFEGSNNTNLARYYKSFGTKECTYLQYKKNEMHWMLSKIITFIKWLRKLIR
ncbi:MAG: hypothetical protein HGB12_05805 [Bacteroidetes bacterium]|nr:hypothetical protein [Bacteroidota bacterium]